MLSASRKIVKLSTHCYLKDVSAAVHYSVFMKMTIYSSFLPRTGDTGIRGLTASKAWRPFPKVHPGAFSGKRQGWNVTTVTHTEAVHCQGSSWSLPSPRGPLAVHCFCMCNSCALLVDLLGVSRSMECDFLSVLYYSRFSLAYIVLLYLVFAACSCCWFSCQYLPSDWLERLL